MNGSNDSRNPRKRNAQQMTMFKRALFALNKNDTKPKHRTVVTVSPPSKRPRIVLDESKEAKDATYPAPRSHPRMNRRPRHHTHNPPNSFTKPPPRLPSHNFLHDRSRNNIDTRSKSVRHSPNTRLLGSDSHHPHQHHRNHNHHTRKPRQKDHYCHRNRHQSYKNNHHHSYSTHRHNQNQNQKQAQHNVSYQVIEQCRMKKLWTDFHGDDEYILSELKFCRDTSFFITSNSIAHKISLVIKLLFTHYYALNEQTPVHILDGLACIGGNAYSFAKIFSASNHHIYCNELDKERCNALKHNMNVFQHYGILNSNAHKSRLCFYNLDFLELHMALGTQICDEMDVVFLDPEWNNGDDYKQTNRGEIHLFDIGGLHLHQVIDRIVSEWYPNIKIVAIKLAKNYDQDFIHRKLQKCKLIETKAFRVGQISFHNQKLIVIVRSLGNKAQPCMSFEEMFHNLPKMTNRNNSLHSRDVITVKLLS